MATLPPDLRKALLNLPQKEKDQLLARLVSQDAVLTWSKPSAAGYAPFFVGAFWA